MLATCKAAKNTEAYWFCLSWAKYSFRWHHVFLFLNSVSASRAFVSDCVSAWTQQLTFCRWKRLDRNLMKRPPLQFNTQSENRGVINRKEEEIDRKTRTAESPVYMWEKFWGANVYCMWCVCMWATEREDDRFEDECEVTVRPAECECIHVLVVICTFTS